MEQYRLDLSREEINWLEKWISVRGVGHVEAHNIYDKLIELRRNYNIKYHHNIDRYENSNISSTLNVNIQYVTTKN